VIVAAQGINREEVASRPQHQDVLVTDMAEQLATVKSAGGNALRQIRAAWSLFFSHRLSSSNMEHRRVNAEQRPDSVVVVAQ
jgi:hypothetical protein